MLVRIATCQLLLSACVALIMPSYSFANIVISIEHELVAPGGVALVGVFASSNMGDNISGFNLPLDIGADGKRPLPTGFTFRVPPLSNLLFSNTGFNMPEPQITIANVDAIPSGFVQANQAVTLSAVPTKLFDIVIDVGPGVPVGTVVPIHILRDSLGLFNVTSPNGGIVSVPGVGTPAIGSITVVPEPGSLAQIGTIALLIGAWFRSRQYRHCLPLFLAACYDRSLRRKSVNRLTAMPISSFCRTGSWGISRSMVSGLR